MISIDYFERELRIVYKAVCLHLRDEEIKFESGSPDVDFMRAVAFLQRHYPDHFCMLSSDCDHFVSDNNGAYEWHYEDDYGSFIVRKGWTFEMVRTAAQPLIVADDFIHRKHSGKNSPL